MRLVFCLFLLGNFVSGTKRGREEIDNTVQPSYPYATEISDMINTLAGRLGSYIDMVRAMPEDNPAREILLACGRIEIAAFDIIIANPNLPLNQLVDLLNSHIPVTNRISKIPFHSLQVNYWRTLLTRVNDENIASLIGKNTRVLTSPENIVHLQLSDDHWNMFVYPSFPSSKYRHMPPPKIPTIQLPNSVADFATRLPPIAREYIHQQLRKTDFQREKISMNPLIHFDSKSVLFRNLIEYMLTLVSIACIDGEAAAKLTDMDTNEGMERIVAGLNSLFSNTNPPEFNLLYTADRLSLWTKNPHLINQHANCQHCGRLHVMCADQNLFITEILNPLTIEYQPSNITPQAVKRKWEEYERRQSPWGRFYIDVNTEIRRKKLDPNFSLVSPPDVTDYPERLLPEITQAGQRAVLIFLNETDTSSMKRSFVQNTINRLAAETNSNSTQLYAFASALVSRRYLGDDIAHDLTRINRLRIRITPATILENAKNRGVETLITPEHLFVYYQLLMESVRSNPMSRPFRSISEGKYAGLAEIDYEIWRKHFVSHRLTQLSS